MVVELERIEEAKVRTLNEEGGSVKRGVWLKTRAHPRLNPLTHSARIWVGLRTAVDMGLIPGSSLTKSDENIQRHLDGIIGQDFQVRSRIADKIMKKREKAIKELLRHSEDIVKGHMGGLLKNDGAQSKITSILQEFITKAAVLEEDPKDIWVTYSEQLTTALHQAAEADIIENLGKFCKETSPEKVRELLRVQGIDTHNNNPLSQFNNGLILLCHLLQNICELMDERDVKIQPIRLMELANGMSAVNKHSPPNIQNNFPDWIFNASYTLAVLKFPIHAEFYSSKGEIICTPHQ